MKDMDGKLEAPRRIPRKRKKADAKRLAQWLKAQPKWPEVKHGD